MGIARNALLWVSENRNLRQTLPKYKFVRRAVTRFMPGEELDDALHAAEQLKAKSINTILTHLGENISDEAEAKRVADHYVHVLHRVRERNLDASISVKLTQLGLDLNEVICLKHLESIVECARVLSNTVWIDMEQSIYVDRTISIFKKVRQKHLNVGLCLQSYLYRTKNDLDNLLPLSPAIRLVKGAYAEPATVAFPKKSDVDANFFELSRILFTNIRTNGLKFGIGTHDKVLIRRIIQEAATMGLSRSDYDFQLLYGIQSEEQLRLAQEGFRVRALISYGTFWFPWYVRRLAERPANVLFVLKNVLSR